MSGRDDDRWMDDIAAELRAEVPVRPEWRARLLDEIARDDAAARPTVIPIGIHVPGAQGMRRAITIRPLVGVAAALLFMAIGVGGTLAVLALRGGGGDTRANLAAAPDVDGPEGVATTMRDASASAGGVERGLVRFALSAPQASRVALVGSFNDWNPVATPLVRDTRTGAWTVTLRLPPGRHVYAFVVDGDVTADPAAPRAADDDFGSPNSVVLVSGPAS